MKRVILTYGFIFFLASMHVFAQDTLLVPQAKVDSVKNLIDSRRKDDEEKVHLLNEYARTCFTNKQYKKGLDAAIVGRKISEKIKFEGGNALYYLTLATFLGRNRLNYFLDDAYVIAANTERNDLITKLNLNTGHSYYDNKMLVKMLAIKNDFLNRGEKEIYLAIIDIISYCYYILGNNKKEEETILEGINISKELNQFFSLLTFLNRRIYFAERQNQKKLKEALIKEKEDLVNNYISEDSWQPDNYQLARIYLLLDHPSKSIKYFIKSMDHFRKKNNVFMVSHIYNRLHDLYGSVRNYANQAESNEQWIQFLKKAKQFDDLENAYDRAFNAYLRAEQFDKFLEIADSALHYSNNKDRVMHQIETMRGQEELKQGNYKEAHQIFLKRNNLARKIGEFSIIYYLDMADLYSNMKELTKAKEFINIWLNSEYGARYNYHRMKTYYLAHEIYNKLGEYEKALGYLKEYQERRDELYFSNFVSDMAEAKLETTLEKKQQEIEALEKQQFIKEQQTKTQRLWIFSISGAFFSALLIAFILYRNNRQKQKTNAVLASQKEEVENQKEQVETTLEQLKSTQTQLIHSEKMASLGELTAGIAHEIQNPLNFVNNFSEVNAEMIDELREELAVGSRQSANEIIDDIEENEKKINHHGKRAEAIVKGMLQHSRTNSGEKELTDINALVDEYLRLSYHGMRARDKSFNADFKLEADESLPKINVVPQDIGRVLLNVINNAFQAVKAPPTPQGGIKNPAYIHKPTVIVKTSSFVPPSADGGMRGVKITVADNGPGIPQNIIDKIFQPFFTTKPTGQGTGLGLSLSYDIVKAHGGKISIETEENKGSTFTIQIPLKS